MKKEKKMKKYISCLIVLSLIIASVGSNVFASQDMLIRQFERSFGLQHHPTVDSSFNFIIRITPNVDCEFVELKNVVLDNLTSQDLKDQQLAVKKGVTSNFEFKIDIPKSSISGYEFSLNGCSSNSKEVFRYYFAFLDDTVLIYFKKPNKSFEEIEDNFNNRNKMIESPASIQRRLEEKENKTTVKRFARDSDGNHILVTDANRDSIDASLKLRFPEYTKPVIPEPKKYQVLFEDGTDSSMTRRELDDLFQQLKSNYEIHKIKDKTFSVTKKIDPRLKRMRELEKTALTDSDSESMLVDGIIFVRNKGEFKFHEKGVSSKMDKRTHYDARIDSIGQSLKGMESEYVIDLREPHDLEFAKKYLDSLISTEQRGFYVSKVPLEIRKIFRKNKIKGLMLRSSDRENRIKKLIEDLKNDSTEDKEDPVFNSIQQSTVIFSEVFDGAFPSFIWEVWEDNYSSNCNWDTTSCRKASGAKSVWCASGDVNFAPCDYYDYNLRTNMDMVSGIDISQYANVKLTFRIYSEVGNGDGCAFYFSNTADELVEWELYDYIDTTTSYWISQTKDIPAEWDSLFISYLFYSFEESWDEDGTYIDNIYVTGDLIQYPNLIPLQYAGWSGPIVPSSITNTTTISTLYYDQPTYFDFSVYNSGVVESGLCRADIYIDSLWYADFFIYPLLPYDFNRYEDLPLIISSSGQHEVKIVVDPLNEIEETVETDNIFIDTFTWIEAPILMPNLTWHIPSSWNSPINIGSFYSNQPTSIGMSFINNGNASSGSFTLRLFLDNIIPLYDTVITDVAPGDYFQLAVAADISDGLHSLTMNIDFFDSVDELNETDNSFSRTDTWSSPEVTAQGQVNYSLQNNFYWVGADSFYVELWEYNENGTDVLKANAYTNQDGWFEFSALPNIDSDGSRLDLYVKVFAYNSAARSIELDAQGVTQYVSFTSVYSLEVLSGTHTWDFPYGSYNNFPLDIDQDRSRYFYVADMVRESKKKWLEIRPTNDPDFIYLVFDSVNSAYNHFDTTLKIKIPSSLYPNNDDVYDIDVINHEYGHRLSKEFEFFDDGGFYAHSIISKLSTEFAANEGFGHFWSLYCKNSPLRVKGYNNYVDISWFNAENGLFGEVHIDSVFGTVNHYSDSCEGTVASILWDILDIPNDDFSGQVDWGGTTLNVHPDGIKDSLTLPIDTILSVLLDRNINGHRPDNITEFWEAWFQAPSFGHDKTMEDIFYEHGIIKTAPCCYGNRGNADGGPDDGTLGGSIDIGDLIYLIDFMFRSGPPPICFQEANVDGSVDSGTEQGIDIADIIYLTAYMFQGGAAPVVCP